MELVKFKDMAEPQTADYKTQGSSTLPRGMPKHRSTLLQLTLPTLRACIRYERYDCIQWCALSRMPDSCHVSGVVMELVKFKDMAEPQTADYKTQGSSTLPRGMPKHRSTLLQLTLPTLRACIRYERYDCIQWCALSRMPISCTRKAEGDEQF